MSALPCVGSGPSNGLIEVTTTGGTGSGMIGVGVATGVAREVMLGGAALPSALGLSLGWTVTFSGVGGRGDGGATPNTLSVESTTWGRGTRSEEHTSELRSLMRISYAVFCLKKKKT